MKTLIIDNYDSFTYNLFQLVAQVNQEEPIIIKNDTHTLDEILKLPFDNIIISPGPGHPNNPKDFGICAEVIKHCDVPILGICLGHQGIVTSLGGEVSHAPIPIHGQLSSIRHEGDPLFFDIPNPFNVVRYHSLIAQNFLPDCLQTIATTEDGLIMAVKHKTRSIWGVQYHPESICTEFGHQLLYNFKNLTPQKYPSSLINIHQTEKKSYAYELQYEQIPLEKIRIEDILQHFKEKPHFVFLDSSLTQKNHARFSILGCLNGPLSHHLKYDMDNKIVTKTKGNSRSFYKHSIFDFLKSELKKYALKPIDLPFDFYCGYVGYFGYELYQETLNLKAQHQSPYPDAQFLFLDRAIVIDHENGCCYLLAMTENNQSSQAVHWFQEIKELITSISKIPNQSLKIKYQFPILSQSKEQYLDKIKQCLTYIRDGESYEICLTNRLNYEFQIPALDFYQILRKSNPAPYAAFLKFESLEIVCASMERFLKMNAQGQIETKPIKGTLPRGKTPQEDEQLCHQLQQDTKFRAENLMIVDLLRNDLGKICEIGSVQVPKLMDVESYASVHQLVSTIVGQVKPEYDAIDCIKSVFPGGSMTGAPKIRTVEIIAHLETESRNIYSGAIGYLSLNGAMDFNIVIRTAVVTPQSTSIGAGGAIIALSDPFDEFDEILLKAKALDRAIQQISNNSNIHFNPSKISQAENSLIESNF